MAYSEKLSDIIVLVAPGHTHLLFLRNVKFIPQKSQYSFCISLNLSQNRATTQSKICKKLPNSNFTIIYDAPL